MKYLYLSDNEFTGSMPAELERLTELDHLYLRDNQLSGAIPTELGELTRLTKLYLSGNSLTGCIPDPLDDLAEYDLAEINLPFCSEAPGMANTVSFQQASYEFSEGQQASLTVLLANDPEATVTIPLGKANRGGASNSDYSGVPGSVTFNFNSGDTARRFTFRATDDTLDYGGEGVKLCFGTLPQGVSAGNTSETVVIITDDDIPAVTVGFEQGSYRPTRGAR